MDFELLQKKKKKYLLKSINVKFIINYCLLKIIFLKYEED